MNILLVALLAFGALGFAVLFVGSIAVAMLDTMHDTPAAHAGAAGAAEPDRRSLDEPHAADSFEVAA